jgi:hypothetical protein
LLFNPLSKRGSYFCRILYLLYNAVLPITPESTTANFATGIAALATDNDPFIASQKLQTKLAAIQNWLKMENKS